MKEKETFKQLNKMMEWFCNSDSDNCYLLHLINLTGATLAGVKPAELLNIPMSRGAIKQEQWEECKGCFLQYGKIKIREIKKQNGRKQVLVYHHLSLAKVLSEEANLKFLRERGYPGQYSIESYVDLLVKRLQGNNFPHEIGIFLGYPLKDVLGFIGCSSLKLIRRRGWNFYGDEEISNRRYESFLQARTWVKEITSSLKLESWKVER